MKSVVCVCVCFEGGGQTKVHTYSCAAPTGSDDKLAGGPVGARYTTFSIIHMPRALCFCTALASTLCVCVKDLADWLPSNNYDNTAAAAAAGEQD